MKFKIINAQYDLGNSVFTVGIRTKSKTIVCGSVTINNNDYVTEIHIEFKTKDNDKYPIERKKELLIDWISNEGYIYHPDTIVKLKSKKWDGTLKKWNKIYTIIS